MFHYSLFFPQTYKFWQSVRHEMLVRMYMPYTDEKTFLKWRPVEIAGVPNICGIWAMKVRKHAKNQQHKMRSSTPWMTIGVERYPELGYNRMPYMGTYVEWAKRRERRIAKMFGPNFVRPSK